MFFRICKIVISVLGIMFVSSSVVLAWTGLIASDGDPLTFTKWNELVTYVQDRIIEGQNLGGGEGVYAGTGGTTYMEFKSINAGTGITVTSDANEITVGKAGSSIGSILTENVSVTSGGCTTSTTPYKSFLNAYIPITTTTPGTEIVPTGTIDPDNNSTGDAAMIDNNYTNLSYNNSSAGSANKSLPAIDFGSSQAVGVVRLHWWTPATYGTTSGNIQGSNNGTTWTNLVTGIVKNTGATGDTTDHTVTGSWRYIRFFNVTGQNATWVVLSETEAFSVGTTSTDDYHVFNRDIEIRNDSGNIEVCNNEGATYNIEINSVQ